MRPQNHAPHGFVPVEGVAEDQTERDVAVPKVRTYRPECSVRSEGSATQVAATSPFLLCISACCYDGLYNFFLGGLHE
jgi:hypothetical protein